MVRKQKDWMQRKSSKTFSISNENIKFLEEHPEININKKIEDIILKEKEKNENRTN